MPWPNRFKGWPRRRGSGSHSSATVLAKVVFTIQRKAKGRRVNGKCVPETAANRSHPRCTRYKSIGSFKQAGDAGPNAKRFSGKIGKKRLAAGSYRVKLVATDSAGNHSAPRYLNIRVVGAGASAGR